MLIANTITKRRMYADLSWAWPIISPPEDYVDETEEYIQLIKEHSKIPVSKVLNLGCGGGHNDRTLASEFELTGVDISEDMLNLARESNPGAEYINGDMRSVRLGQGFDAVTVFDSISYMTNIDSLKAAFATAYAHLRPGGVFLACVEESRDTFKQNKTRCSTHTRGDIEITLIENYYDPDPDDNSYEANFIYLIRRSGELTIETDMHQLGIFELKTWMDLMPEVGLEVFFRESKVPTFEGETMPILIGQKPVTHF